MPKYIQPDTDTLLFLRTRGRGRVQASAASERKNLRRTKRHGESCRPRPLPRRGEM